MKDLSQIADAVRVKLLDSDAVTLPGIGTFVATQTPAFFSNGGRTINPPERVLSFRKDTLNDKCVVEGDLSPLRDALSSTNFAKLPGIGSLKMKKNGTIVFLRQANAPIFPQAYTLEPLKLKFARRSLAFYVCVFLFLAMIVGLLIYFKPY